MAETLHVFLVSASGQKLPTLTVASFFFVRQYSSPFLLQRIIC